ncbi:MAG: hypothetical protein KGQ42_07655 [Alphaproteobacteria bacterium]|nr:hypothetical protein [Alphaproteobacteria bacterium]MDE2341011.1 hypothetical protein [Alphaproteobacteria bacterium]
MGFLKIIFWVVILIVLISFTLMNIKTEVGINVFPTSVGPDYNVRLPTLVFVSFLMGLLPYFLLHHATRWSLNRKLKKTTRELEDQKQAAAARTQAELAAHKDQFRESS